MANAKTNASVDANNVVKFKLIFVNQKKKDGSTFVTMKTILSGNKWIEVRFGDNVNTKLFKGENQIISALKDDVKLPLSLEPYVSKKDGKTKYPYVWVENITGYEKLIGKVSEPKETTQDAFQMDEEETKPVEEKQ